MKIFVATYNHKYGTDVRAFRTSEGADKWRIEIADEYWDETKLAESNKEKPEEKERMAQIYWDYVRDAQWEFSEYFEINICDIEE
jgi:hypothetical protein